MEPLALRLSSSAVGLGLLRSSCLEIGSLPELGLDRPYRWRHPQGEKVSGPWARPEATGAPAKGSEELETRAGAWDAEERTGRVEETRWQPLQVGVVSTSHGKYFLASFCTCLCSPDPAPG